MSNKLYVGGLNWDTNDQGLRSAFERFGKVEEAIVVTDRDTGRSRGFGFVTFSHPSEAKDAVTGMDGNALDGRNVNVSVARERAPRSGGGNRE